MLLLLVEARKEGESPYVDSIHGLASQAWTLAERSISKSDAAFMFSGLAMLLSFIAVLMAMAERKK